MITKTNTLERMTMINNTFDLQATLQAMAIASSPFPQRSAFPALEEALALLGSGELMQAVWGVSPKFMSSLQEANAHTVDRMYVEVATVLMYLSGGVSWPIAAGELFDVVGDVHNLPLLETRGVHKPLRDTCTMERVAQKLSKDNQSLRPQLLLAEQAIRKAFSAEAVTVLTTASQQAIDLVMKAMCLPAPTNLVRVSPAWANLARCPIGSTELFWALSHLGFALEGTPESFSWALEGEAWQISTDAVVRRGARVRAQLMVAGTEVEDLTPATVHMAVLLAVLGNNELVKPKRLLGGFQKAITRVLVWSLETDENDAYVEPGREFFVAQILKSHFWAADTFVRFQFVGYPTGLALRDGVHQSPTFNEEDLEAAGFDHNLVHMHKGTITQWMPASLVLIKMSWVPMAQRQAVYETCCATLGVPAGNKDTAVFLLSTKESKLTKRVGLEYAASNEVVGLEVDGEFFPGKGFKRLRHPGQEHMAEGVQLAVGVFPYAPFLAGVSVEVGTVCAVHRDVHTLRADVSLDPKHHGFTVAVDPDFAIHTPVECPMSPEALKLLGDKTALNVDITWPQPVRVVRHQSLVEIPFTANGKTSAFAVQAPIGGDLERVEIRQVFMGTDAQLEIRATIVRMERESKFRSLCKHMTTSLPNGAGVLFNAANAAHPHVVHGDKTADLLIFQDGDKSEAMAYWKLDTAVQTALQVNDDGTPIFPTLFNEVARLQQLQGQQDTHGLVVHPLTILAGETRPLCEMFEATFGQDVWVSFQDTALEGAEDGNHALMQLNLLTAQIRSGKIKGSIGQFSVSEEPDFLSQVELDDISLLVPAGRRAKVIATGQVNGRWTNLFVFWVDKQSRSRMELRTYGFIGWENAPLIKVEAVEATSIAKSVTRMPVMAGAIRGINLAGDVVGAHRLASEGRRQSAKIVALRAMSKGAAIRDALTKEVLETVDVTPATFQTEAVAAVLAAHLTSGTLIEGLAELFPRTVFRFTTREGNFTVWFPAVKAVGAASGFSSETSMAGLLKELVFRLSQGAALTSAPVVSLRKRVKAMLTSLSSNHSLLKGALNGRMSMQCKTIVGPVPGSRFLVRYTAPSELAYETSAYAELLAVSKLSGSSTVNGEKFLIWRAPLTFPLILEACVVRPGEEGWEMMAERPHVAMLPAWGPYADRGDSDGDGRTFTPYFDGALPLTTYHDVLQGLVASTGKSLEQMEEYIADHQAPKSRKTVNLFGLSDKCVQSEEGCRKLFTRATAFHKVFGVGHEVYMRADIMTEVLNRHPGVRGRVGIVVGIIDGALSSVLSTRARLMFALSMHERLVNRVGSDDKLPAWASESSVAVAAEAYECTLAGLNADAEVVFKEFVSPVLYGKTLPRSTKEKDMRAAAAAQNDVDGAYARLQAHVDENGVASEGHFAKSGLNAKALDDYARFVRFASIGRAWQRWASNNEVEPTWGVEVEGEPVQNRVLPSTQLTIMEMALLFAQLTFVLSKGQVNPDWVSAGLTRLRNVDDAVTMLDALYSDDDAVRESSTADCDAFGRPSNELLLWGRLLNPDSPLAELIGYRYCESKWYPVTQDEQGNLVEPGSHFYYRPLPAAGVRELCQVSSSVRMLMDFVETALPALALELDEYDVEVERLAPTHPTLEVKPLVSTITPPVEVDITDLLVGLSDDQVNAVEMALYIADPTAEQMHLFLTGEAGSGKSHTLEVALQAIKARYGSQVNVRKYGTTGTAAENIGTEAFPARTVNSGFGIGGNGNALPRGAQDIEVGRGSSRPNTNSLGRRGATMEALFEGDVLLIVIDEVSMLTSETLHLVKQVAEVARAGKPETSIRFLLVGDFKQLPVVDKAKEGVYNSPLWAEAQFQEKGRRLIKLPSLLDEAMMLAELTTAHRQTGMGFLSNIRKVGNGICDEDVLSYFERRFISSEDEAPADALFVYHDNASVGRRNEMCVAEAEAAGKTFVTINALINDKENIAEIQRIQALAKHLQPSWVRDMDPIGLSMRFFVGAPVQFRLNDLIENRYANGSTGVVTALGKDYLMVRLTRNGQEIKVTRVPMHLEPDMDRLPPTVLQLPLVLAAAMTGHKVQGQTIDGPVVVKVPSYGGGFGWLYVALTRVRDIKQLYILGNRSSFARSVSDGGAMRQAIEQVMSELRSVG